MISIQILQLVCRYFLSPLKSKARKLNPYFILQDALVGFTIDITHLDGHIVTVTREKVTAPGSRIRKKGEGMPNYENNNLHGILFITFDVEFPKSELTDTEKEGTKWI